MELNDNEKKFLINALDVYVRQAGLNSAGLALSLAAKIQESMEKKENE